MKPRPFKKDLEDKTASHQDIRNVLTAAHGPGFEKTAVMLLEQAERLKSSREERARVVEARATTLLGTVPIAATLLVAASGQILDKLKGPWSGVLMLVVVSLLVVLLLCAYIASRAVLKERIRVQREPRMRQVLDWAAKGPDSKEVRIQQVAERVTLADRALYVAEYKRAQLKCAYTYYRFALSILGSIGAALIVYAWTT